MNPNTAMRVSLFFPLFFLSSFLFSQQADTLESKGAIIIASLEGQVTVVNNTTQQPLPASQVKAGGLLVDGHTVKTGPASKVILLLSNGTVSTIKSDSSLNIKKFTQTKFDAKGKSLSEMKGEPSASQTVLDLNVGDMILDVKKLDKQSSFNIESPVGTAGIRGTIPYLQVMETEEGGFNQTTSMIEGELAFTPKGSDKPILLGPGDSLTLGILPNGAMIPPTFKTVSIDMINSVNADKALINELTGDNDTGSGQRRSGSVESSDEAEQQEQKNDADAGRSAKSAGADNNGSATLGALADQGIISPTDENALVAVDAINAAGGLFADKTSEEAGISNPNASQRYRRNSDSEKSSDEFVSSLFGNFGDVVEVTAEADELGLKSPEMFNSLLENSENSGAVKEVVAVAAEIGVKDKANMESMFTNVDQADDLKEVMDVAKKTLGTDDGAGGKKLDASKASILSSTLKNADKADSLKSVMDDAAALGAQDAENLTAVFANADKADDLKEVMAVAKENLGKDDGTGIKKFDTTNASVLTNTLRNADKATDLKEVVAKAETAGAIGSLDTMLSNADKATDLKEVVAKAESAGASASLGTMFANADKATDLKEVVAKAESAGASASLGTMFANADKATDLKEVVAKAESVGASASLGTMFANADKATDLKEVVAKAESAGASASLGTMFANADKATDLKEVVAKAESAGASASLGKMFENADRADEFKRVTDQLDSVGLEGGALDVFEQIESVADVFEAVAGDGDVDQTFAKNILGNAKEAGEVSKAIKLVQDNGGVSDSAELLTFAQKDVSELKAINKVAEKFEGSENALKAFVGEGLDQALQLEKAFESGDIDADTISSSVGTGGTFSDVVGNSVLQKLQNEYASNAEFLEVINLNPEKAQDINFALSFVEKNSPQESALFANLDKIGPIMNLSNRFENDQNKLNIVYNNLDVAPALDQLVTEFSIYPKRLEIIMENADIAPSILDYERKIGLSPSMFESSEVLKSTLSNQGLSSLLQAYPDFDFEIRENQAIAGKIIGLISLVEEEFAKSILSNLEEFDKIETLVFRAKQEPKKLESLFANLNRLDDIKSISDKLAKDNIPGGQDALFSNLDTFNKDPGYYLLAMDNPRFLVRLHEITGDLSKVSSTLAYELVVLDLSRNELERVLGDLIEGPLSDGPTNSPPDDENLNDEFSAVSLLESHIIKPGELPLDLVLSESQVLASQLFQETLDTYDALSELDHDDHSYDGESPDSHSDGVKSGVLGGVNITFTEGDYDLSKLSYESLIVASSEDISLSGEISFTSATSTIEELLFVSGASISFAEGTIIDFSGDDLGFGSFDSLEIINVDLHAEDSIGVRSLDSIVIENSEFATRGAGADEIHMIAAADLTIDNLRFSDQVRQITMEAMTINLSNLNFPNGSNINLNSAYGGIDGVYPNFGSVATGRVNFIKNVKYNSNPIDSRTTFDQHGANISIGVLGK